MWPHYIITIIDMAINLLKLSLYLRNLNTFIIIDNPINSCPGYTELANIHLMSHQEKFTDRFCIAQVPYLSCILYYS